MCDAWSHIVTNTKFSCIILFVNKKNGVRENNIDVVNVKLGIALWEWDGV
jgi:hypothetical protein